MGISDFWLQSNNGKKYTVDSLKDIQHDDIAKNPKLKKIIQFFNLDSDGDGVISAQNTQGKNEWNSIFNDFKNAAGADGILTDEELDQYLKTKNLNGEISVSDVKELIDFAAESKVESYLDIFGNYVADKIENNKLVQRNVSMRNNDGNIETTVVFYENETPIKQIHTLDKYEGETLAERTITESDNNNNANITVITYQNGKALKQLHKTNDKIKAIVMYDYSLNEENPTITVISKDKQGIKAETEIPGKKKVISLYKSNSDLESFDSESAHKTLQYAVYGKKVYAAEYDGKGHTIVVAQENETPNLIARTFNVKLTSLLALNKGLSADTKLVAGTKIIIPKEVDADSRTLSGRKTGGQIQKQAAGKTINKIYASSISEYTVPKQNAGKDVYEYAEKYLTRKGVKKDDPNFEVKKNNLVMELTLLNGSKATYTEGSKVKYIKKTLSKEVIQELVSVDMPPNEQNQIFYARFNYLSPVQQKNVIAVLKRCKERGIKDSQRINTEILKYYPEINLFDTDVKKATRPTKAMVRKYLAQMLYAQIYAIRGQLENTTYWKRNQPFTAMAMEIDDLLQQGAEGLNNLLGTAMFMGIANTDTRRTLTAKVKALFDKCQRLMILCDMEEKSKDEAFEKKQYSYDYSEKEFDKLYKEIAGNVDYEKMTNFLSFLIRYESAPEAEKKNPNSKINKMLNQAAKNRGALPTFESLEGKVQKYTSNIEGAGGLFDLAFNTLLMYVSGGGTLIGKFAQSWGSMAEKTTTEYMTKAASTKFGQSFAGRAILGETSKNVVSSFMSQQAKSLVNAPLSAGFFMGTKVIEAGADGSIDMNDVNGILESYKGLTEFIYLSSNIASPSGAIMKYLIGSAAARKETLMIVSGAIKAPTTAKNVIEVLAKNSAKIGNVSEFLTSFGMNAEIMAIQDGMSYGEAMLNLGKMDAVSKMVIAMVTRKNMKFPQPNQVKRVVEELGKYEIKDGTITKGDWKVEFKNEEELTLHLIDRTMYEASRAGIDVSKWGDANGVTAQDAQTFGHAKQIEQFIQTNNEPYRLDENRSISKGPDGIYRLVINVEGKELVIRADSVEKFFKIGTEYAVDEAGTLVEVNDGAAIKHETSSSSGAASSVIPLPSKRLINHLKQTVKNWFSATAEETVNVKPEMSNQYIETGSKVFDIKPEDVQNNPAKIKEVQSRIEELRKTEPEKAEELQIVLDMFKNPTKDVDVTDKQIDAVVNLLIDHYASRENYLSLQVRNLGLDTLGRFDQRLKSQASTRDKVGNYIKDSIKKGKGKTLLDAYQDVRDAYACRTVFSSGDYMNHPDVVEILEKGNYSKEARREAELRAAEIQSEAALEKLKQSMLAAKEGRIDLKAIRISNYSSPNGVPIFSAAQLFELKRYGVQQGVDVSFIKIEEQIDPKTGKRAVVGEVSKTQDSGYTALQVNFETSAGEKIEWQYRDEVVDRISNAEHIDYNGRTGKRPWAHNPALKPLYEPVITMLETMPDEVHARLCDYFTDYYAYGRKLSLKEEATPPRLEDYEIYTDKNGNQQRYHFDKRLTVENLMKLYEVEEGFKAGRIAEKNMVSEYHKAIGFKPLEGDVNSYEATEVAPFARHLEPHFVQDPIQNLQENLNSRIGVESFDLKDFEQTGLKLKYSHNEFTKKLHDLVNGLKIEEQQAILEKFNIKLIYTGNGFELSDIPRFPSKNKVNSPLEKQIMLELKRFIKDNEFQIDNAEAKAFLDGFVKVVPEFLFTVGKKQHGAHAYTLDVHILKVLQKAMEHPDYKNLSPDDKLVLNTAIMLHDIRKRFFDEKEPDDNHAEAGQKISFDILKRFNLPLETQQRILKLVQHHEFFKRFNQSYLAFKMEDNYNTHRIEDARRYGWPEPTNLDKCNTLQFQREVEYAAGNFKNQNDFNLAKIITIADLKSVNPKGKYTIDKQYKYEDEALDEYVGFEHMVTRTANDAEFYSYFNEVVSYVDKEYAKCPGAKLEDEFVHPEEARQKTIELLGKENRGTLFERESSRNGSYGIHREDYNFMVESVQRLLAAGVNKKDVSSLLKTLLKTDGNHVIDFECSNDFIKTYIENIEFLKSHEISAGGDYDYAPVNKAENFREKIRSVKEKENLSQIFKKYNVKNEWEISNLTNILMIENNDYSNNTKTYAFSPEAHDAMVYLFEKTKLSPNEIALIINNSYTKREHRWNQVDLQRSNVYFNKQKFDVIVELIKTEPVETAVKDAAMCFVNKTPESGWILEPQYLEVIKEFNRLGLKNKDVVPTLFDRQFKDGNKYQDGWEILSITKKEEAYQRALKYAKQGFDGMALYNLVWTHERKDGKVTYSEEVSDKMAILVKRGMSEWNSIYYEWVYRQLFDGVDQSGYDYKFNHENYDFVIKMLDMGIEAKDLNSIIYNSLSSDYYAKKAAPEKIVEKSGFTKAQTEALVKFYKEIGFDKLPNDITSDTFTKIAASFMEIVELTPEEQGKMFDTDSLGNSHKIKPMNSYMAPFRIVNEEKFNQTVEYYKRGVSSQALRFLTQEPELYKELKNEQDLHFIKTANDADLVSAFWNMRNVKSINELSKQERIQFTNNLMMHKSEFADNNVSEKISILPRNNQEYSNLMKQLSDSFGLNNTQLTKQQVSQMHQSLANIASRLQDIKFSEIYNDAEINQIISQVRSQIPNFNKQNLLILQRVVKTPEYSKLSESDKKLMNIASMFSKSDSNTMDSAIDACVFAKKMGMSDTDAMKVFAVVKNSDLTNSLIGTKKMLKVNSDRSYIDIVTDEVQEAFETAAMELKDYNNYTMAKLLYTANENFVSPQMLQEYAPELYKDFLNIRNSVKLENGAVSKDTKAMQIMQNDSKYADKLEEVKLRGREKYSLSRNLNKILKSQIDEIKSTDILLPQTNLSDFIKKQSPEWVQTHTKIVNGRKVLVIYANEIPDFYMLSHTTQAFNILGKADATTNMSNFEIFAMLFNNKTICLSYSGNGKIAVVGDVGLLIQTPNTTQYVARGTDISSVAKDIPTMISEYISHRSKIVQRGRFQTKTTKEFDRNFFSSLIKEELQPGYRELLQEKLRLKSEILGYESEYNKVSLETLKKQLAEVTNQMRYVEIEYRTRIENIVNKANGSVIDLEFIRENDAELGKIYDKILNTINVEHRGDEGLMRTEYHNEVLGSNTIPVGIFVRNEKNLYELTDDYLKKAEEEVLPIVIYN